MALVHPPLEVGVDDVDAHASAVGERRDERAKCFGRTAGTANHAAEVIGVHAHLEDLASCRTLCRDVHFVGVINDPLDEVFESGSEHS